MKEPKIPMMWLIPLVGVVLLVGIFLGRQGWKVDKVSIPPVEVAPPEDSSTPQNFQSFQEVAPPATNVQGQQQPTQQVEHQPDVTQPAAQPAGPLTTPLASEKCWGRCWQYDENNRTMIWTGPTNGAEDVWQGDDASLSRVRDGWKVIFGPMSVPGEIEACVLILNGKVVKDSCDGVLYQVPEGQRFEVISAHPKMGGFRWKPLPGYGYRR